MASRFTRTAETTQRARTLRRDMTDAERFLWKELQSAQVGVSFRRQHSIGRYVADFCAPSLKLVIELDGGQHAEHAGLAKDAIRTTKLNALGYRVLRFWNNDVLENIDGVLYEIARIVEELSSSP